MLRPNRWTVLALACFGIGCLALSGLLRPLGDAFRYVTLPLVRFVSSFHGSWGSSANQNQLKDLEHRLSQAMVDKAHVEILEEENRVLRAQAKFLTSSGYESVGARIIGREIKNDRALLLIDRGRADHVELGQAVVAEGGIYVGKISLLQDQVSTVETLTDRDARVAAALAGKRNLIGVVEGRGNGAAILTYLPSSAGVMRDQVIVTAGTEDKVPPNLPLGIVNAVMGTSTDPFLTAALEPLIRVEQLDLVSILQPSVLRR